MLKLAYEITDQFIFLYYLYLATFPLVYERNKKTLPAYRYSIIKYLIYIQMRNEDIRILASVLQ